VKFLKNKGLVIVLAVFAVGLVFKNLVWPFVKRHSPVPTVAAGKTMAPPASVAPPATPAFQPTTLKAAASSPPASTARVSLVSLSGNTNSSHSPMDVSAMRSSAPAWAQAPRRDPFHARGGIKDGKSAREQLTLMGTLQQTRSTLAVVNNQVLSAGDTILGFKIESVDENVVWVSGPNGRESIEFRYSVTAPITDIQGASPQANRTIAEGGELGR
jgi:hypothetical protein